MAWGTILGAAAGGLASGAASSLAGSLFGGGSSSSALSNFQPVNINAGGLRSKGGKVTASPERLGLVGNISSTFPEQADILSKLRESVKPGFGALTSSRLAEIESARQRSIGNLRENLQRRRVLGSSFAGDALARGEMEFAQAAEKTRAESFLQELGLTQQLTQQEFETRRGEFQTMLDEFNIEANLAAQLASGATAVLGANARIQAQLDAAASAGAGKFFGQAFQPLGSAISSEVSGLFNRPTALGNAVSIGV